MSSRTRGKRNASIAEPTPVAEASSSRSTGRSRTTRKPKLEPEVEQEDLALGEEEALALGEADEDAEQVNEEEEEDYEEPTPSKSRGGSRRGKGKARGGSSRAPAGRGRNTGKSKVELEPDVEEDEGNEDQEVEVKPSRRLRKSVSYREVLIEEPELQAEDEEEEEDAEGEIDEEEEEPKPRKRQPPIRLSSQTSNTTPRKRSRPSIKATPSLTPLPITAEDMDNDENEEEEEDGVEDDIDTPSRFDKIPGGSGRGGFSVKGAAAAAARARWAKVRREKIERGEDPDEPRVSSTRKPKRKRDAHIPDADNVVMDSTIDIKGQEYKVGDDELILDEDEKGNTKVDAEGRLQGGREYKLVTFTSPARRNSERLYTMTIDAARACGYTDSLAFLRRCPQILKLSCTAEERQLLIEIGRIAGNLRHRQVTMVSVRNVFKLMGARVIKGGKWVTDDYYEEESLEKCKEMGWEPGTLAEDEEVIQQQNEGRSSRRNELGELGNNSNLNNLNQNSRYTYSLTPFYTIGGPTTTFGSNATSDPFTESGYGNKRQKLKSSGVNEENWIYLSSKDSQRINNQLKEYRNERLLIIDKQYDLDGKWVYINEEQTDKDEIIQDKEDGNGNGENKLDGLSNKLLAPNLDRKRSGLSRDVTRELTQQLDDDDNANQDQQRNDEYVDMTEDNLNKQATNEPKPEIIVEKPNGEINADYHWGLGSWSKGVIKAVYEPHTNIPHVPQHTQPTSLANFERISYNSIISSSSTTGNDIVQSTLSGSSTKGFGISSLEYVFEPSSITREEERMRMEKMVKDAEDWEKEMRRKRRG